MERGLMFGKGVPVCLFLSRLNSEEKEPFFKFAIASAVNSVTSSAFENTCNMCTWAGCIHVQGSSALADGNSKETEVKVHNRFLNSA